MVHQHPNVPDQYSGAVQKGQYCSCAHSLTPIRCGSNFINQQRHYKAYKVNCQWIWINFSNSVLLHKKEVPILSNFYKNYLSLCASANKSPSRVANEIGLSNAAANGWKKGKEPSDITLQKLADYFHVAVETLKEQKETAPTVTDERDLEMLSLLSRLTPEQKEMLLLQIKGLLPPQE